MVDLLQERTLTIEESEFFNIWGNNHTIPKLVVKREEFFRNLICRYEYDVWERFIDWNLFIMAGGSVVSSLLINATINDVSDIDLFFSKRKSSIIRKSNSKSQSIYTHIKHTFV